MESDLVPGLGSTVECGTRCEGAGTGQLGTGDPCVVVGVSGDDDTEVDVGVISRGIDDKYLVVPTTIGAVNWRGIVQRCCTRTTDDGRFEAVGFWCTVSVAVCPAPCAIGSRCGKTCGQYLSKSVAQRVCVIHFKHDTITIGADPIGDAAVEG